MKLGRPEYFYHLYLDNASAKCPPDIFGSDSFKIPNDAKIMLDKINEFSRIPATV